MLLYICLLLTLYILIGFITYLFVYIFIRPECSKIAIINLSIHLATLIMMVLSLLATIHILITYY